MKKLTGIACGLVLATSIGALPAAADCTPDTTGRYYCTSTPIRLDKAPQPVQGSVPSVQTATIAITDGGFSPATLNVSRGGTIQWTNNGVNIHSATTTSTQFTFDSGGLTPGQSFTYNFTVPGTYTYTSSTDCAGGVPATNFPCQGYSIVVS